MIFKMHFAKSIYCFTKTTKSNLKVLSSLFCKTNYAFCKINTNNNKIYYIFFRKTKKCFIFAEN